MSAPLRPRLVTEHRLADLLPTSASSEVGDVVVTGVGLDSRTIEPGWVYVALPGTRAHGAQFAAEAVRRGAVAVLTDAAGRDRLASDPADDDLRAVPVVVVDDPRLTMAAVAAQIFDRPSAEMQMFGITGTNGKTTTTFLVEAGLRACAMRVGTIGTIGFLLDGHPLTSSRTTVTTPESVDLQALLAVFREAGTTACVMEVSSHALALHRADAMEFDVVGFTNLGRDHLDFHVTLDDYFEAKAKLFTAGRSTHAVVMIDDEHGRRLAARIAQAGAPALTTVTSDVSSGADVVIVSHEPRTDGGSDVVLDLRGRRLAFALDLPGAHNVRNAALALAMIGAAGHDVEVAATGLHHAQVPGRMQRVPLTGGPTVVVDFAHTPQAITEAVRLGESYARTAVVVGAGGDRDRAKREPMGEAAAVADLVVVTDDNPRTENPASIRAQVVAGARSAARSTEVLDIGDRREAIRAALTWARPDDLVLVLGKGHEQGQQVGDAVIVFDDTDVVTTVWQEVSSADA